MILDALENAHLYAGLSPALAKAFDILADPAVVDKADDKYTVDGDELFYLVDSYTTYPVDERFFEAHRRYIDVQFIVSGCEMIGVSPLEGLFVQSPYNDENDVIFYHQPEVFTRAVVTAGMFCVLLPEDGHMPCCQIQGPAEVKKVVVKIKST